MAQTTTTKGAKILLVEDNEDLRENATLVLTLEGYEVYSARDGQEAMDMLTQGGWQPDLIVSDIAMPRLDGYGFFEAVHAIPELSVVPFIFLTARGSPRDIRLGKQLGVDDYLPKPFIAEDFLVAIENRLRRSREMKDHARTELNDARRTMVQLLSHELRTPLTYITGGFALMLEGIEQNQQPEDIQLSMGLIHNGTQRLHRLAEQMVIYAELINGHARMQLDSVGAPADLLALLKDTISVVERESRTHIIQFERLPNTPMRIEVFTVPQLIHTAFYEVLRNATAYSAEGSNVQVQLSIQDKMAVISVQDEGRGIPQENLDTIWDVMIQAERQKYEQQGVGMGLPIVKQITRLHGGSILLESQVGQGTRVTLRLPLYIEG